MLKNISLGDIVLFPQPLFKGAIFNHLSRKCVVMCMYSVAEISAEVSVLAQSSPYTPGPRAPSLKCWLHG